MAERGRHETRRPASKRREQSVTGSAKSSATGSARGVATLPPRAATAETPSGSRFTGRAVALVIVAILLLTSYATSLNAWWNQRQEIAALELRVRVAENEIAELEDIEERWQDPAFIRNQARERFGWVMPGEVGYRVIGLDGQLKGEGSTLDEPAPLVEQTWVDRLNGSFHAVDHPPESISTGDLDPETVLKKKKD
jgi:cell division protein FtsB